LARAHQGLLAGSRTAGHGTVNSHLNHLQMRDWYLFDEGGKSGSGGWKHARTNWNHSVAMPHGWSVAELWLLIRDSLLFEDGEQLVLLGGIPPDWFTDQRPLKLKDLPTKFGPLSLECAFADDRAVLKLGGKAIPPRGFILYLPETATVTIAEQVITPRHPGEFQL